jgi:glycosyltransferase involved in cell wall biosynthesis
MSVPSVLVVIPVKNEEAFIEQCLRALLDQKYEGEISIVVVDNGSTDKTLDIVNLFGDSVTLLKKEMGTIGSLRNFGARYSTSDMVAFIDGDSVAPIDWIRVGCDILLDNKKNSCVGFAAAPPRADSCWIEKVWYGIGNSSRYKGTIQVDWLCSFNLIVRRSFFDRVSGFDEQLETGEDFDLGMRLNKYSKIIFSDTICVTHLDNPSGLVEFFKKEFWRGKSALRNFLLSKDKSREVISVFVPIAYVFTFIGCVFSIFLKSSFLFWICFSPVMLLPVYVLYKKSMLGQHKLLSGWFFVFTYLLARGLGAFF